MPPNSPAHAIPFNRSHLCGRESSYLAEAVASGKLSGDGPFTKRCHELLATMTSSPRVLLTHSCTAALEVAALLLDLQPGDEVIMPAFTFVSSANAFVLRRAMPVFVDIELNTWNIDPAAVEAAVTPRTRAVLVVHYAGVGCDIDAIMAIARRHGLVVIEDAAQAIGARHRGRALGSIGDLGALSFHDTKNVSCGEGGALMVNRDRFSQRAEMLREKGTDRSRYLRGEIDKYTWQDQGSSYLPSELQAAMLLAQLEQTEQITRVRVAAWNRYHTLLAPLQSQGWLTRPTVPAHCEHNGHIYGVLLAPGTDRDRVLALMRAEGVSASFHYVPLHSSPAGQRYGRAGGSLHVTELVGETLIRLPMWMGLGESQQLRVVETLARALVKCLPRRGAASSAPASITA